MWKRKRILTAALQICDQQMEPGRTVLIGHDTRALAAVYLAQANWILGEFGRVRELLEGAVARATQLGHLPTLTATYAFEAIFEAFRGDAEAAGRASEKVMQLSKQHELPTFLALGSMPRGWSCALLGDIDAGKAELRDGLTAYVRQGTKAFMPFYQGLLAEIEARTPGEEAVRRVDEALSLAQETGEHGTDAFLHRIRGGAILLRRDPVEYSAGGGGVPHRHRHRPTAEGKELRATRGAVVSEALSIDRPSSRRPCRARARARRFFTDAGVPRRSARHNRCSPHSLQPTRLEALPRRVSDGSNYKPALVKR